jgi:hypothetical protein
MSLGLTGALFLAGCAPVAMTAGGIAGSAGVNHALNGIAYKTFTAPVRQVRTATIRSLNRMEMKVTSDVKQENGWRIEAVAAERTIEIDLEALTPSATRMRVVTNKGGFFFKDSATSTEIILQTAQRLESASAAQRASTAQR